MKNIIAIYKVYVFILFLCISLSCKKNKESELDKLPPITQNGSNTFGCLINGEAYIPSGYSGNKPNFYIIADPGFYGNLDIRTYKAKSNSNVVLDIFCYDIAVAQKTYQLNGTNRIWITYEKNMCQYKQKRDDYVSGYLKITKYDFANGIVSGEFECKLFDNTIACDTIRITNGRFDYKF